MVTRREFLDALAVGAAGLAVGTTAKSYGQILGSNDRLNFAVIGLNGRAYAHLLFIVYDLGTIRDTLEFTRDLECTIGVEVIVVKH